MSSVQPSRRGFFAATALVFIASAAAVAIWMSGMVMSGMVMPGGWTMSMTWMRMSGQSWSDMALSFLALWAVMMVAMMLPSLTPMLWRYRQAAAVVSERQLDFLTLQVALGYFLIWILLGAAIFPLGAGLAILEMQQPGISRLVPFATGGAILAAGALQFTAWKRRQLICCREAPDCRCVAPVGARTAWGCGIRLGFRCVSCCAPLTAILLVTGVMDPGAMIIVAAAIAAERLLPGGEHAARAIGAIAVGAGLLLIAQAAYR